MSAVSYHEELEAAIVARLREKVSACRGEDIKAWGGNDDEIDQYAPHDLPAINLFWRETDWARQPEGESEMFGAIVQLGECVFVVFAYGEASGLGTGEARLGDRGAYAILRAATEALTGYFPPLTLVSVAGPVRPVSEARLRSDGNVTAVLGEFSLTLSRRGVFES